MQVSQLPKKGIEFLKEVRLELRRVTWPTRQEAIKHNLLIIGLTLTVAAFLGGLDFLFSFLLNRFVI